MGSGPVSRTRSPSEEAAWQEVRHVVLERDEHRCRDCGEAAARRDLDVHHLIPRSAGGHDEASNCITLCDGCHAARHPHLQVSLSRRMMQRWALRLAHWVDRGRELPEETRALTVGLRLFGLEHFRDGQLEAVLCALRGESLLVVRATGSGKALCFQLPAVLRGQPATFVLSPLKALMVDQVSGLQKRKLPATFINGDVSREEKEQRYSLLEQGALTLLYVAPERFNPERVRPEEIARLGRQYPSFLVVDEAHLVDRWGEDFRIDYSRIAEIRRRLGDPPVLAFTATAGVGTQERIKQSLGIPDARTLVSGVDRPNIALIRLQETSDAKRAQIVAKLIANLPSGRVMVFVPTTNVGREVQQVLRAAGCELPLYHSQLPASEREQILGRFTGKLDPPLRAVICTSAFSMGLDVPDVRAVVNWQHPSAVEDYLQEFGRAGRDGQPALSLLFGAGGREAGLLHWMADKTAEQVVAEGKRTAEQANETLRGRRERIDEMGRLAKQRERCFRAELNEALMGPAVKQHRSWALRILDWAFARDTPVAKADACCDVCNPELAERLRHGTYAPQARASSTGVIPDRTDRASTVRRPVRWTRPRLAVIAVLVVALAASAAIVMTSGGSGSADAAAIARESFQRYTRAFADAGEFSAPTVTGQGATMQACARHVRNGGADNGRYRLCLLIDADRPSGKRVTGGFKTNTQTGRRGCYGAALDAGLCG
jgi:ATP-dependent DNA helicase RecQ